MGILDICLRSGKHIITIMLLCEKGEISGESFGFSDIRYIQGYKNAAFRINIRDGGREVRHITKRVDFKIDEGKIVALFKTESGNLRIPVEKISEIVSQE